ncbi:MAG: hypothetical protein KME47_09840 [Nodosilinea sp. WJT8-NPBG4]|jgi:hypothetical protein|nr:hypothetical protein [Nodosilinea sp. WJT8-NPBG4]
MSVQRKIIETIEENDLELIIYSAVTFIGSTFGYTLSCKAYTIKTESGFARFESAKQEGLFHLKKSIGK